MLDLAGNQSFASNAVNVTFDGEQPEISFHAVEDGGAFPDDPSESPTNLDAFTLYISFSKPVIGFAEGTSKDLPGLWAESRGPPVHVHRTGRPAVRSGLYH